MPELILDVIVPKGEPLVYRITKKNGKKKTQIASALVAVYETKDGRYAEVLQIFVDRRHRRAGLGIKLVEALQKTFDMLITGWNDSEPPGRELFLKMGFVIKKSLKNGVPDTMEWIKQ